MRWTRWQCWQGNLCRFLDRGGEFWSERAFAELVTAEHREQITAGWWDRAWPSGQGASVHPELGRPVLKSDLHKMPTFTRLFVT